MEKAETIATWGLVLICNCPNCNKNVDLLDDPDFWDGRSRTLAACEQNTPQANNLDVYCPECGHQFEVCCEY